MTPFAIQRLACGYFFAVPGLAYGVFTARMPALKQMVSASDTAIGFLLLAFGAASFCGLLTSAFAIARFGAKNVIGATCVILPITMTIAGFAFDYWHLIVFGVISGLVSGFCEVAMNAQGMGIELRYKKLCMSSLHACFSLGGMAGSLFGSLFAWMNCSPALNFLIVCGGYLCLLPIAWKRLDKLDVGSRKESKNRATSRAPLFIYLCGIASMMCYVSEGSVGEWGSILLHSVKGAPQDQAALVFACFCLSMVVFRFLGDRVRQTFDESLIVGAGGLIGAISMCIVLLSSSPNICLVAYATMGIGFAPIVPILFSRAGKCPGVDQAKASSAMSVMSYTGLLVFPPFLGFLGDSIGLDRALWLVAFFCVCISFSGPLLLGKRKWAQ